MLHEELNKKLAEWVGFKYVPTNYYDPPFQHSIRFWEYWFCPDGEEVSKLNFTESLDACRKWLLPRLWICNITLEEGVFWSVDVSIPDLHGEGKHGNGKAGNENFSLALCLAIEKLINS